MDILQKTQNRGMRAILRCNRYTRVKDMLDALGFLNIWQKMVYNICVFIYKIKNGMMPGYLRFMMR